MKYTENMFESVSLESRETRMVRFCKYFLSLYNAKTLSPFTQFSKFQQIEDIRLQIEERLTKFAGLLKKQETKSNMRESDDDEIKNSFSDFSSDSAGLDSPLSNSLVKEKRH